MTDGRDRIRRSKTYPWSDPDSGQPFYGRWDIWLGTLLTVLPIALLVSVLVSSLTLRLVVAAVAIALAAEVSRAALGVLRADRAHRRAVAEAMSEETGAEITVDRLRGLYGALHRNSGDSYSRPPKRVTDSYIADDGSKVTVVMSRDETVKAVRERDDR